jgi:hypothetical protein
MKPPLRIRIRWWLADLLELSLSRLRDRVDQLPGAPTDPRIVLGSLLVLALLVGGGFAAARAVAGASSGESEVRIITTRQKVQVKVHGHIVTRWRTRELYAEAKTVMQTQTIQTPHGIKLVRRPVTRYQVVYRKGGTRTLSRPVTDVQTLTNTSTRLVTVTNHVTDTATITQPETIVDTTTVVSTETDTLPVTVTVTLPGP